MKAAQIKKLKKEIESSYQKYMCGIQVNIFNLSKVQAHVEKCVMEQAKTIEQGYAEAREIYREN